MAEVSAATPAAMLTATVRDEVDQQRSRRDEAWRFAKIHARHDVRATAVGVGVDGLPVREHDNRQNGSDGAGNRTRKGESGEIRKNQNAKDLFGGVRHRGERVRRQHRQGQRRD